MELPGTTSSIFEYLQKGLFISANSTNEDIRRMYNTIENYYEPLYEYFAHINFCLEQGNEFYYFSRKEPKATLQQKIERAFCWIDILDFFKGYDETFGVGYRFSPAEIAAQFGVNVELGLKVDGLKKHVTGGKEKRKEILDGIIDRLVRESFIENESVLNNTYKVMSSWNYLEKLVESINLTEDIENEVSE